MADTTYQDALKRREVLKRELKKLNDFIELYEEIFGTEAERVYPSLPFPPSATPLESHAKPQGGGFRRKNPPRHIIGKRAREVILARGAPMARGDLLKGLADKGMTIQAADPSKAMGTIMWRLRKQFVNFDGYGYWPKDVPYPPLNYQPEEEAE